MFVLKPELTRTDQLYIGIAGAMLSGYGGALEVPWRCLGGAGYSL